MKVNSVQFCILLSIILFVGCTSQHSGENEVTFDNHVSNAEEHLRKGETDEAVIEYGKALRMNPASGETHYILGEVYFRKWLMSHFVAQRNYLKATMEDPNNIPPIDTSEEEMKIIYEKYGLDNELKELALAEFREAVKLDPTLWMARYHIATNYLNEGKYKKAISEYKAVIEINPNYANAHSLLGKAYYKTKRYKEAIASLERAIEIEPDAGVDYYTLGLIYLDINDMGKVLAILDKLESIGSSFYDDLKHSMDTRH